MQADPLYRCWEHLCGDDSKKPHTIYLSPCGKTFTQADAKRLSTEHDRLILVCGHYEGIDQRFIDECVDEEISLGDFVLTGGEIAAMAVADAVCRLIPGVLSDPECFQDESHWDGLLEYPQYSRPEVWHGRSVPKELLTGDHCGVLRWRRKEQLRRTMERRPDMFAKFAPVDKLDSELLKEIEWDKNRPILPQDVVCRRAEDSDLDAMDAILAQAKALLRHRRIDQWNTNYPAREDFLSDMFRGECYVFTCEGEVSAFFTLTAEPEAGYAAITDGKWSTDAPYTTLHRCAVSRKWLSSGLSDRIINECERLTLDMGIGVLRVDTHRKNKAMQALLTRCGFQFRGNVLVNAPEGHDPRRKAYEKILRRKEANP